MFHHPQKIYLTLQILYILSHIYKCEIVPFIIYNKRVFNKRDIRFFGLYTICSIEDIITYYTHPHLKEIGFSFMRIELSAL